MTKSLMLLSVFVLLLLAGTASAQSISYGNGWKKECFDDGKCAYSNHQTFLRWDNQWIPAEWLNISNGNWSYKVEDVGTKMNFTADGKTISIPKANTNFNLQLFKISPSLTYSKTALQNNMVNVNATVAYLVFPYSLSQIRDYADEHNIKVGRWVFRAGQEHIDIYDDVVVNHTYVNMTGENETYQSVTTLDKNYYQFRIVNGEIRLYFLKAEANKLNGNITFALNSWSVGEGGNAWTGNSTKINTTLNRDTNRIMLQQVVNDYISYWRFDGSSGTVAYDENITANNNGTLTDMNIGLDNGTSGWNSSGRFGNVLNFDGADDYVNLGTKESLRNLNNITISAWVKLKSDYTTSQAIIVDAEVSSACDYAFTFGYTDGKYEFWQTSAGPKITSTATISDNIFHHVVATRNGSTNNWKLNLYIDGVWDSNVTTTSNPTYTVTSQQTIGRFGGYSTGYKLKGLADNVMVFNRVLTNAEINQTMNNTMFSQGNITTWYDSGAGNETYQIDANATTDANSNYTIWYANNGTGSYTQLGGTLTGNNSLSITTKYQNTDVQVRLAGNTTSTPELTAVTFWTQTVSGGDTTPPTYSNASHNQTIAGLTTLFSIQYNDDTALHPNGQWIFSTNNTGEWVNESAVNWTATPEWANVTKTLNSTVDIIVGYRWYGTDNAGNSGDTPIYTLTVTSAEEAAIEPEQVQFIFI